MADKTKIDPTAKKGPPMTLVLHDGAPTWANRTKGNDYRCTKCNSVSHPKAPERR